MTRLWIWSVRVRHHELSGSTAEAISPQVETNQDTGTKVTVTSAKQDGARELANLHARYVVPVVKRYPSLFRRERKRKAKSFTKHCGDCRLSAMAGILVIEAFCSDSRLEIVCFGKLIGVSRPNVSC